VFQAIEVDPLRFGTANIHFETSFGLSALDFAEQDNFHCRARRKAQASFEPHAPSTSEALIK
jgi:hypothetical protein